MEASSGMWIMIGAALFGRYVSTQALQELDREEKLAVIDAFSNMRGWTMFPLIAIVAVVFFMTKLAPGQPRMATAAIFVLMLTYMVVMQILVSNKLRTLDVPSTYRHKYLVSKLISYAGVMTYFASVWWPGLLP